LLALPRAKGLSVGFEDLDSYTFKAGTQAALERGSGSSSPSLSKGVVG
jgi:hypothetical protein